MANIQAVSFGHHQNKKHGPSVGGTIGMVALGAATGTGVYVAKHRKELKGLIDFRATRDIGGNSLRAYFSSTIFKAHKKPLAKFAGIGAGIATGAYLAVKTISAIVNKD